MIVNKMDGDVTKPVIAYRFVTSDGRSGGEPVNGRSSEHSALGEIVACVTGIENVDAPHPKCCTIEIHEN